MKKKAIVAVLTLVLGFIVAIFINGHKGRAIEPSTEESITDTLKPSFYFQGPETGLSDALDYYDVKFPEIVYAQAQLETGNFTSTLCIRYNNIFGIYDSSRNRYKRYKHWTDCVVDYKNKIQKRYRDSEDYYSFLKRIHYATSPNYIITLKQIVRRNGKINKNASPGNNQ